jgi:hypothetical protein
VNVKFFPDQIQIEASQLNEYLILFFSVFWAVAALSGLIGLLKMERGAGIALSLFTFFSFGPFSYLCYNIYDSPSQFLYKVNVNALTQEVSFGDSAKIQDISIPYSEWSSYGIRTKTESEKSGNSTRGTRYTDTILLVHKSGFTIDLSEIIVINYINKSSPFSRYSELNREVRRFQKILPRPVLTFDGKPDPAIYLKANVEEFTSTLMKKQESNKSMVSKVNFPFRWKYAISYYTWGFFLSLIGLGNLCALLLFLKHESARKVLVFLLLCYSAAGIEYYYFIHDKDSQERIIRRDSDQFTLLGLIKGKPERIEAVVNKSDYKPMLGLPQKWIMFPTNDGYEKTVKLARGMSEANSESLISDLGSAMKAGMDQKSWDLSDLSIEEIIGIYLVLVD